MAKKKFEIIGSVRVDNIVYIAGQEDELSKVLTAEQFNRLKNDGIVIGEFASGSIESEEAPKTKVK